MELCQDREAGGVTPSLETLAHIKEHISIPVYVMIRARGGDFNFSTSEFGAMERDVITFKENGADGFVFGVLTEHHEIDLPRTKSLVYCASPLPCTFHRAFDEVRDKTKALEDVVATGCRAVLSSGGAHTALAGSTVLRGLVDQSAGRIDIIAGGGVRARHLLQLNALASPHAFHSSGIIPGGSDTDTAEVCEMKGLITQSLGPSLGTLNRFPQQQSQSSSGTTKHARDDPDAIVPAVSVGTTTPVEEVIRVLQ